jgi:hypothetical protein
MGNFWISRAAVRFSRKIIFRDIDTTVLLERQGFFWFKTIDLNDVLATVA